MIARERCKAPEEFPARASNVMSRFFRGEEDHIADRSDYSGAMARLNAAIDPRKLFIGFYEEMFGDSGIERICNFLGLSWHPPRVEKFVHTGIPLRMSDDHRAQAVDFLAPQYRAVTEAFGRVPERWGDYGMRVS